METFRGDVSNRLGWFGECDLGERQGPLAVPFGSDHRFFITLAKGPLLLVVRT